jgi:insulysin
MLRILTRPRRLFPQISTQATLSRRLFAMEAASWTRIPANAELPSHLLFNKPLERPDLDEREYRIIKLDNGLQALLIHDEKTDKAAAAMDVGVGNLSDPVYH